MTPAIARRALQGDGFESRAAKSPPTSRSSSVRGSGANLSADATGSDAKPSASGSRSPSERKSVADIPRNAATRAADRCCSSRRIRASRTAIVAASATDTRLTSRESVLICLPQLEFDRDLDDHVDRRALTQRGRKAPLANRVDGALIEP